MKYGEIWMVAFLDSVIGHEFKKDRPCIILQSNETLVKSNMITIMPLTSNTENKQPHDIVIMKTSKNKLFYDSVIKVRHLKSFDPRRFISKVGEADDQTLQEVIGYLKIHFNI